MAKSLDAKQQYKSLASQYMKPAPTKLTQLDYLKSKLSSAEFITYVSEAILQNKDVVESISLHEANITPKCLISLISSLVRATNLKELKLSHNPALDVESRNLLVEFLKGASVLQSLDLSGNPYLFNSNASSLFTFGVTLSKCHSLQYLNFAECKLEPERVAGLIYPLVKLSKLSFIDFTNNPLGSFIAPLVTFANQVSSLKEINLSHVGAKEESLLYLLYLIKQRPDLTVDLQGNFIDSYAQPIEVSGIAVQPMLACAKSMVDIGEQRAYGVLKYMHNLLLQFLAKDLIDIVFEYCDPIPKLKICAMPQIEIVDEASLTLVGNFKDTDTQTD